jgi:hypothetical protein
MLGKITQEDVRKFNEGVIDELYKKAIENGETLWPDEALRRLIDRYKKMYPEGAGKDRIASLGIQVKIREDTTFYEAHKYALESFYKYYVERKKGAPQLNDEYLNHILNLYKSGKSYQDIALEVEPDLDTPLKKKQSKEKIRKQITEAKKRKLKKSD